jgi:hypothetical protein
MPAIKDSEKKRYHHNDITLLIVNVLTFVYGLGKRPLIIDFMNYVRRFKIDTRESLFEAIVQVIEKVEITHKKKEAMFGNSMIIDERSNDGRPSLFSSSPAKIIVHKNPEGLALNENDIADMKRVTALDHTTVILYAVWGGIKRLENETFTEMKNRYKKTDKRGYAMYSRDDCVLKTLHSWLEGSVCSPELYSKDEFKDTGKYKHLAPFQVYMIIKGQSYRFLFEYSSLRHNDLLRLVAWIKQESKQNKNQQLGCTYGSESCNRCQGRVCRRCRRCNTCLASHKRKRTQRNNRKRKASLRRPAQCVDRRINFDIEYPPLGHRAG